MQTKPTPFRSFKAVSNLIKLLTAPCLAKTSTMPLALTGPSLSVLSLFPLEMARFMALGFALAASLKVLMSSSDFSFISLDMVPEGLGKKSIAPSRKASKVIFP